jgi:hypothetical protein
MTMTATQFRKDLYGVFDHVARTGIPARIIRKGQEFSIVPLKPRSKLGNLRKRQVIVGDPESLVHTDWSKAWKPYI